MDQRCGASQPTHTPLKLARQKPVKNLQPTGSRHRRKLNDNNAGKRRQVTSPFMGELSQQLLLLLDSLSYLKCVCPFLLPFILQSSCLLVLPVINIPLVLCETPSIFPLDYPSTRCPPNTRLSTNLPLWLSLPRKMLCIIKIEGG